MLDYMEFKNSASKYNFDKFTSIFSEEAFSVILNNMETPSEVSPGNWYYFFVNSFEYRDPSTFFLYCGIFTYEVIGTIFEQFILPIFNTNKDWPYKLKMSYKGTKDMSLKFENPNKPFNFNPQSFMKTYEADLLFLEPDFYEKLVFITNSILKREVVHLLKNGSIFAYNIYEF